jgi:hypothetical protein
MAPLGSLLIYPRWRMAPLCLVGFPSLEDGIDLSMVQDLINERTQVKIFNIVDEMDKHRIVVCLDNLKIL